MADAKDPGPEAVKALFDAVLKQSELLGSWSLAVFAACVALITWCVQQRREANPPTLRALPFVLICGACQGASILMMYCAYGQMVNVISGMQLAKFQTAKELDDLLAKSGIFSAQLLFFLQFLSFFAGVISMGAFSICNYRLLSRSQAPPADPISPMAPQTGPTQ